MRNRHALIAAATVLVVGLIVVAAGVWFRPSGSAPAGAATPGPSVSATTLRASPSATCSTWGCVQDARFAAAAAYIKKITNGHVGIEVKDRLTGAVWLGGEPTYRIWAGSTPKLAFAVALRERSRDRVITLDAAAYSEIEAMLHSSDNEAADTLWNRYAKGNPAAWMNTFRSRYGMTTASYVSGFPSRWGFVKCTPKDLAALMTYILERLGSADRTYIVNAMRSVAPIQQWGVWGAGSAERPGVKDGWSRELDSGKYHQITATVGFAGPDERYVVAAMYHQNPGGDTLRRGVQVLTDLAALVFAQPVPAPAVVPPEDSNV
jgi:hypothetical protein